MQTPSRTCHQHKQSCRAPHYWFQPAIRRVVIPPWCVRRDLHSVRRFVFAHAHSTEFKALASSLALSAFCNRYCCRHNAPVHFATAGGFARRAIYV